MKHFYKLLVICLVFQVKGQGISVTSKGNGLDRTSALNDARRQAIATGIGTRINAESIVQDQIPVRDAVTTQTLGVVTNERIISEKAMADHFEVEIEATVNKDAFDANVRTLSQMVGGIRFLTIVNPDIVQNGQLPDMYRIAVDRINEYLLSKKYRVLESKRYFQILKATKTILDNDESDLSYEQKLGMLADAQMLFEIGKINIETLTRTGVLPHQTKVTFDIKVYDNCTGELLGTAPLESEFMMLANPENGIREAIKNAIERSMVRVLFLFQESMGAWINEGAPYRVRIYNTVSPPLTSRDLRSFKNKLTSNPDFGGSFEPNLNNGFFLYNLTFKKRSDQMSDLFMDYADETETLKPLKMNVSFQFGRFICLTPLSQNQSSESLQILRAAKEIIDNNTNPNVPLDLSKSLNNAKTKVQIQGHD